MIVGFPVIFYFLFIVSQAREHQHQTKKIKKLGWGWGVGGRSGGRGVGNWGRGRGCWLRTYFFENSLRNFYFTPGNSRQSKPLPLEIPQNCITPLEIRHDFFWITPCKLHIVFNKFLEILLTVSSIHLEVPILLILFLFSNMLLSKIQTPK